MSAFAVAVVSFNQLELDTGRLVAVNVPPLSRTA